MIPKKTPEAVTRSPENVSCFIQKAFFLAVALSSINSTSFHKDTEQIWKCQQLSTQLLFELRRTQFAIRWAIPSLALNMMNSSRVLNSSYEDMRDEHIRGVEVKG